MSAIAQESRNGRANPLTNLLRRLLDYPERRFQREAQQRARWIDEARNAPTVQDWIDGFVR